MKKGDSNGHHDGHADHAAWSQPRQRLLTVADLAVLPSDLPSGTVLYELDNGRLVIMPGQTSQVLTENDVLTVQDIIPGFKMLVADAFT